MIYIYTANETTYIHICTTYLLTDICYMMVYTLIYEIRMHECMLIYTFICMCLCLTNM